MALDIFYSRPDLAHLCVVNNTNCRVGNVLIGIDEGEPLEAFRLGLANSLKAGRLGSSDV